MQIELIEEFRTGLTEIKQGVTRTEQNVTDLNTALKAVQDNHDKLQADFNKIHRAWLNRSTVPRSAAPPLHGPGLVSDDCARFLTNQLIVACAKSGRLEILSQSAATRDALLHGAREFFGLESKAALSTIDIPLPVEYSGELRALI